MERDPGGAVTKDSELVERLTAVTEQLEDIVNITKGKSVKEPHISVKALSGQMKKKMGSSVPMILFAIFRMFALKNLLRGRMYHTAYTLGKQLGLRLKVNSRSDLEKEILKFELGEKLIIDKLDNDGVKIRLNGTITSMGIKNSTHPICYFERGLLCGAAERLLRRKLEFVEETCCSQGDKFCTFRASSKKEKQPAASSSSSGILDTDLYSKENIKLLTTLASHSIIAIENTLLYEEAKKRSIIDGLTRVFNHAYFHQTLKIETTRSSRYKTPLSLIMIDVDKFKNYNDRFGHRQGDGVLKEIAAILVNSVREVDVVSRYGGDEFAVILPQTNLAGVRLAAERIVKKIVKSVFKGDVKKPSVYITLSMGVAFVDGQKITKPEELFKQADTKLLLAKRKGGNKVMF